MFCWLLRTVSAEWQPARSENDRINDVNINKKICETYDEPDDDQYPTRVLFFIFESSGKILTTPYGNVELTTDLELPKDINKAIDFEPID